jgi:phospholipid/cholesterol/gamma-HCH transport system ATP-binding protein
VVGGSGTGKSVLMRSILGLRKPDAGRIQLLGVDARERGPGDAVTSSATPGYCSRTGRCSRR